MNSRGEFYGVGMLILAAVAIIVAMTMLPTIASNMSFLSTTYTVTNEQITAPAVGSSVNLKGQAVSGFSAVNGTSSTAIPASNYTITNYVVSNGELVSTLTAKAGAIGWQGKLINVTYTYEPYGYDTNAGGRAVSAIVVLLAALAVAVVVVMYVVKNSDFDFGL